jgi:hypothetical protein
MMQRQYLNQKDQDLVNRWRLILVGLYSSLALLTILAASFQPVKEGTTVSARTSAPDLVQHVNLKP